MNKNPEPFPKDPALRRFLIILSAVDAYEFRRKEGALGCDTHILEVPFDSSSTIPESVRRYAKAGTVLVQCPYEQDLYFPMDSLHEESAFQKYLRFTEICQVLGAKSVVINQVLTDGKEVKVRAGATREEKLKGTDSEASVLASAEVNADWVKRLSAKVKMEHGFKGSKPDLKAADRMLSTRGLSADSHIASITEMRRFSTNPLVRQCIRLSLTQEAQALFELALSIETKVKVACVGGAEAKSKAELHATTKKKQTVELEVEITF